MNVLMYGWEFPPKISGGLGVACYAIVKELLKKQVDLTLVLPYTLEPTPPNTNPILQDLKTESTGQVSHSGNLAINYLQVHHNLHPYAKETSTKPVSSETRTEFKTLLAQLHLPPQIKLLVENELERPNPKDTQHYEISLLTEVFRYALKAGILAAKIKHDVIHAHDWLTVLAALEAKAISGKPLVFHIHALETDRSGVGVDPRIFDIEKYGLEQADRVIAVSQYTKNNIIAHYGIAPEKIFVVHNGVYAAPRMPALSTATKAHQMVLFLGRITQQKGPYFFIETAKKVLDKNPNVQFVLAGTGDLFKSMVERVAELRIGQNVHFTGFLNFERVQEIYQLADVYVMPSVSEPFGLSALEALSNNVPAVLSKQSGVAEVLNHVLVSDFWDIDDMAAKILALLDYDALGAASLKHTQEDIQHLTWENAAQKIIEVYNTAI